MRNAERALNHVRFRAALHYVMQGGFTPRIETVS